MVSGDRQYKQKGDVMNSVDIAEKNRKSAGHILEVIGNDGKPYNLDDPADAFRFLVTGMQDNHVAYAVSVIADSGSSGNQNVSDPVMKNIQDFIGASCVDGEGTVSFSDLFSIYKRYSEHHQYAFVSKCRFSFVMKKLGYARNKSNGTWYWKEISLRQGIME